MIQRTLLRQSRALSSSIRSTPKAPLARPQFQATRQNIVAFSRPVVSRWYATEPEAKQAEGEAVKTETKTTGAEDPAKKELEAKNKEVLDLKVGCHYTLHGNVERG
jgi:molecular chaperone GrpE